MYFPGKRFLQQLYNTVIDDIISLELFVILSRHCFRQKECLGFEH